MAMRIGHMTPTVIARANHTEGAAARNGGGWMELSMFVVGDHHVNHCKRYIAKPQRITCIGDWMMATRASPTAVVEPG